MVDLRYMIFLLFIGAKIESGNNEVLSPENIVIMPREIYLCETIDSESLLNISISREGDGSNQVTNGELILADEFTQYWSVTVHVEKWEDGDWKEVHKEIRGKMCEILNKYGAKAWKKFRGELSPPLEEGCTIQPGRYTFTDFDVVRKEYDFPLTVQGRFKGIFKIRDELEDEVMCILSEFEIIEKS